MNAGIEPAIALRPITVRIVTRTVRGRADRRQPTNRERVRRIRGMALTMKVVAIDHVQLSIPPGGEAAARRFYGEVLGFAEIPKPEAMRARGGVWFQAGPVQVHLGVEPDMRPSLKAHPALVVTDFDTWLSQLAAAGCRWQAAGADEVPGIRRGHTWDPFGNRIELIEAT